METQRPLDLEFLHHAVDLAARLLEIDRESSILCHESVKKI